MGNERVTASISATVSRHNSAADRFDDAAWAMFLELVEDLTRRPEFARLGLMVF